MSTIIPSLGKKYKHAWKLGRKHIGASLRRMGSKFAVRAEDLAVHGLIGGIAGGLVGGPAGAATGATGAMLGAAMRGR